MRIEYSPIKKKVGINQDMATMDSCDHIEPSLKILTKSENLASHFKRILEANGYGLDWYRNYPSFLENTGRTPVKAVFLDAEVVKESGSKIYEEIRKISSKLAIVLLHKESDRDLVKEAMGKGVYGCIRAPYEDWEILKMAAFLAARQ